MVVELESRNALLDRSADKALIDETVAQLSHEDQAKQTGFFAFIHSLREAHRYVINRRNASH